MSASTKTAAADPHVRVQSATKDRLLFRCSGPCSMSTNNRRIVVDTRRDAAWETAFWDAVCADRDEGSGLLCVSHPGHAGKHSALMAMAAPDGWYAGSRQWRHW